MQFDPMEPDDISISEQSHEGDMLANDGHIYDLKNFDQEVLQINPSASCTISVIGDKFHRAYSQFGRYPISEGVDQCIYWSPYKARKILEFDPVTRQKPPSLATQSW